MVFWLHDIVRKVLVVLLPLLMVMAPAMAQNVVNQGQTTNLSVVQVPGHTYEWELYNDGTVNFAAVPGNCPDTYAKISGNKFGASVAVQWIETGTYFFKVTARDAIGCAMNLKVGMVQVIPQKVEAIITGLTLAGACQRVMLDGQKSTGGRLVYEWSSLDKGGEVSETVGVKTEFLLASTYKGKLPADFRVQLRVTGINGAKDSTTITIKVDRLPVADIISTGKLEKDGSMIVDGAISTGTQINYLWSTTEGKILGPDNESAAFLNGAGNYKLQITDIYGCPDTKSFTFPLKINQVDARDDYARISWAMDTTINVLENDSSYSGKLNPASVHVTEQPKRGDTHVNSNGSIVYTPRESRPGRDHFSYEVCNELNSCDIATVTIDIYDSGVSTSEGFSPNGDGVNDLFVFKGLENYRKSQLYIYTRAGQLIYQSADYQNNWDGASVQSTLTSKKLVPTGVYYYILKLGGTNRSLKGFVYIGY
jgi:gliding motility-associated-like protein